jgi:RimJ/RimL family protein N-acetyltransferase
MYARDCRAATRPNAVCAHHALTRLLLLPSGLVVAVRPMEQRDIESLQSYIRGLSRASRHNRFLGALNELSLAELKRLSDLDHSLEAALIAETQSVSTRRVIGEARYAMITDATCEVALSVSDSWQRRGLGTALLRMLESRAQALGARCIVAEALHSNEAVKALTANLGFRIRSVVNDARLVRMVKTVRPHAFLQPVAHLGPGI